MAAQYDIAVIGGGVIGLALARELASHDTSVIVIDASSETPPASLAAAGMLAPSFEESFGGVALYEFSMASLNLWPAYAAALVEEAGIDIDYRGDGILGVAIDDAGARTLAAQCAAQTRRGASVRMLTGDEARAMEPALSNAIVAAMYAPEDAQVDPVKMMKALHVSLESRGAYLMDDRVVHVVQETGGWRINLNKGGALAAGKIVIATGASPGWPIADVPRPPVFPVKGEAFSIAALDACSLSRVVRGPGAYLCPKSGARIVIGATEAAGRDDLAVTAEAIDGLRANAARIAPVIGDCAETARWAGLRPATPDGAPILGAYKETPEGAWLALGHYRNGILLAPASAAGLASEIRGRPADIDLSAFRVARFG